MMKVRALTITLLATFAPTAAVLAQPERPGASDQVELGRELVVRNCGMCHAVGTRGDSPNPQAPPFRRLHERMDVESLGEGLATGILTQHPAMPEFRFSPHEVICVVRYLRSIQEQRAS